MVNTPAPLNFTNGFNAQSSVGVPDSIFFDFFQRGLTLAQLTADSNWTSATAPVVTGAPTSILSATNRKTLTVGNPSNNPLIYIGDDNTLSTANGTPLYPGLEITMSGYIGPLWALSSDGVETFVYKTT